MIDSLPKYKRDRLSSYPIIVDFINGKITQGTFLKNLKPFFPELNSQGITKSDILEILRRDKIKSDTAIWTSNLEVCLPINGNEIRGFKQWVNWGGFTMKMSLLSKLNIFSRSLSGHDGFDFADYINVNNECVLGLPAETNVRTIADGIIDAVQYHGGYFDSIRIDHKGDKLFSEYHHVTPLVKIGDRMRKGDIIAKLYKDPGNEEGRLVHLHFALVQDIRDLVDPAYIFPEITELVASPERKTKGFKIRGLKYKPNIVIANFKKLNIK